MIIYIITEHIVEGESYIIEGAYRSKKQAQEQVDDFEESTYTKESGVYYKIEPVTLED